MLTIMVLLWAVIVSVSVLGLYILWRWMAQRGIVTKWYDWLIGVIGLVMLLFAIQNFYTSFTEIEPLAAWMFILFPGVPALVLIAIAALTVWRRSRRRIA